MRKSLFVTLDFPPRLGGVAGLGKNVCQNLPARDLVVLTLKERGSESFDGRQKYKIYRRDFLNFPLWPKWLLLLVYVWRILKKEKIEIIQVGQILPIGTVALIFKKILRVPYLVYSYGLDLKLPQEYSRKNWLIRKILAEALRIVTISQYTKNELLKLDVPAKKIVMFYPCPDVQKLAADKFRKPQILENIKDKKILLTVARLVERKGQDIVIRALPETLQTIPNLIYLIVGAGEYREKLAGIARDLNLENNIIFAGEVKEEELPFYYQACDLFIMVPRILANKDVEGFGMVYLEANLYLKPVIGSRSGGVEDAVVHNETGILVASEDLKEISQTIIKLITDSDLAQKLGVQGRARVLKRFNWYQQVSKIAEILR